MQTIQITQIEFDKKVDIEFGYLTHVDRVKEEKARQQAIATVSEKYSVG